MSFKRSDLPGDDDNDDFELDTQQGSSNTNAAGRRNGLIYAGLITLVVLAILFVVGAAIVIPNLPKTVVSFVTATPISGQAVSPGTATATPSATPPPSATFTVTPQPTLDTSANDTSMIVPTDNMEGTVNAVASTDAAATAAMTATQAAATANANETTVAAINNLVYAQMTEKAAILVLGTPAPSATLTATPQLTKVATAVPAQDDVSAALSQHSEAIQAQAAQATALKPGQCSLKPELEDPQGYGNLYVLDQPNGNAYGRLTTNDTYPKGIVANGVSSDKLWVSIFIQGALSNATDPSVVIGDIGGFVKASEINCNLQGVPVFAAQAAPTQESSQPTATLERQG